ncbi:MAG TPA: hypothetical protein VJ375_02880 [Gaiellaceae bacterium]|nr:hypothetical protein [Gaiellaceae bacterium]
MAELLTSDEAPTENGDAGAVAKFFGFLFIIGVFGAGVLVLYRIYPAGIREKTNPGFVDNIFGSNLVVFASRLVLLSAALVLAFAGGYIVVSIVSWMRHRQWLSKMGPFEVSREAIEQLQGLVQFWQENAVQQAEEVSQLQAQLQETNELLQMFMQDPDEGFPKSPEADNLGDADEPDPPQAS